MDGYRGDVLRTVRAYPQRQPGGNTPGLPPPLPHPSPGSPAAAGTPAGGGGADAVGESSIRNAAGPRAPPGLRRDAGGSGLQPAEPVPSPAGMARMAYGHVVCVRGGGGRWYCVAGVGRPGRIPRVSAPAGIQCCCYRPRAETIRAIRRAWVTRSRPDAGPERQRPACWKRPEGAARASARRGLARSPKELPARHCRLGSVTSPARRRIAGRLAERRPAPARTSRFARPVCGHLVLRPGQSASP
jgi:hypothetical protein